MVANPRSCTTSAHQVVDFLGGLHPQSASYRTPGSPGTLTVCSSLIAVFPPPQCQLAVASKVASCSWTSCMLAWVSPMLSASSASCLTAGALQSF